MAVFLGLDCGGSSCRALALDDSGNAVHQGQSGPGNTLSTPAHLIKRNLASATSGSPEPDFVCGCFAGLVNDEERSRAEELLHSLWPNARVQALPDYSAAFMACEPGTDICVIAGTGSIVCSRNGNAWQKSGGRGYLLGNPGSAFRYGQAALQEFLRAPGQASEIMTRQITKVFDSTDESEILAKLYRSPSPPAMLAKLAPALVKDAKRGAEYALDAIQTGTEALAVDVALHVERYFAAGASLKIGLAGGVWEHSSLVVTKFEEGLKNQLKDVELIVRKVVRPPVHGAAALAKEMAH